MSAYDERSGSHHRGGLPNVGKKHVQIGMPHYPKGSSRSNSGSNDHHHSSQNSKPGKMNNKHGGKHHDGEYSSGKNSHSAFSISNGGSQPYQGQNNGQIQNKHIRQDHTWNSNRNKIIFSGSGSGTKYDTGKSRDRILSAEKSRVSKQGSKRAFGSTVCRRGDGRDSAFTAEQLAQPAGKPFSHGLPGIMKDDPALQEERDHIKLFLLANYPSIREDTPNLAYLVEMCINSPTKDLHQVIRTHAFLDLMQYGDMENISSELLHFYVGISQCRGGHGYMGDDVVMCDCDGRVPMCFTLAFTSLLRDYLEMKKRLDSVYKTLGSFKSGVAALKVAQPDDDQADGCIE